jgi:hypothetical protein
MFYVYAGTEGRLVYDDGHSVDYRTRKYLVFHPKDRVRSRAGFLAFKRGDYTLVIPSGYVKIKPAVIESIRDALEDLSEHENLPDIEEIRDLAEKEGLSSRQTLLGAFFVNKYRNLLDKDTLKEAMVLYGTEEE